MSCEAHEIDCELPCVRLVVGAEVTKVMEVIEVALDTCCIDFAIVSPETWVKLGSPALAVRPPLSPGNDASTEVLYFLGIFAFGKAMFRNVPIVVNDQLPTNINILGWPLLSRVRFMMDKGQPILLKNAPATYDFAYLEDDHERRQ